jgi:hypothetical protein
MLLLLNITLVVCVLDDIQMLGIHILRGGHGHFSSRTKN